VTRPRVGARTSLKEQEVIIWRAVYDPSWPQYRGVPGQIVGRVSQEGVFVKTGDATIFLKEVQIGEREPQVPVWPVGTRLGSNLSFYLRQLQARIDALDRMI
jgi:methionyl-tRNA formyltransferase